MVFGIEFGRKSNPEETQLPQENQPEPEIKYEGNTGWIRQGRVKKFTPSEKNGLVEATVWGGVVWDGKPSSTRLGNAGYSKILMTTAEEPNYTIDQPFTDLRIVEYSGGGQNKLCTTEAYNVLKNSNTKEKEFSSKENN